MPSVIDVYHSLAKQSAATDGAAKNFDQVNDAFGGHRPLRDILLILFRIAIVCL